MLKYLVAVAMVCVSVPLVRGSTEQWNDSFYPYRVTLDLGRAASGEIGIDLSADQIDAALKGIAVDAITGDTLAYDKALLVDPATGDVVGGFRLEPTGEALPVDGDFSAWQRNTASPWGEAIPLYLKLIDAKVDGRTIQAVEVGTDDKQNHRLSQIVDLAPGQLYLLDYFIKTDPDSEAITVTLENPAKSLFAELNHSYYSPIPTPGKWVHQRVVYQPDESATEVRVGMAFVTDGAVGAIQLSPVNWTLHATLARPTRTLHLYLVTTSGHRFTVPGADHIASAASGPKVSVALIEPAAQPINPDGVRIDVGEGVSAWSVPAHVPMRAETLALTRPAAASTEPLRVALCRGTQQTLVINVSTGTELAQFANAACDLPASVGFHRLAPIPVFDGFFPKATRVETRFDAMVGLDFAQVPPEANGYHPLAVTIRVPVDATPGTFPSTLSVDVATQEPMTHRLVVPVELTILPAVVEPRKHFNVMFGSGQLTAKYSPEDGTGFIRDSTSVAAFHGYRDPALVDTWISRLSRPDRVEPAKLQVRELGKRYADRLLDFDLLPQLPALFYSYGYTIVDQGPGKAPKLTDWNFDEYDKAIDELVIKRDAPYFCVWHMNGHQLSQFDLGDGTMYSFLPGDEKNPRVQLPREEYFNLMADYFEAIAAHLQKKGIAERALVIIDESDSSTYPIMLEMAEALRSRPNARLFRFAHTTHKTATYIDKLEDGTPIMEAVLDVPMPINDEQFNYFEPEWQARLNRPGKQDWVYYVQTDHLNINHAGLSTIVAPLKLRPYAIKGWYCWAAACWSMPYDDQNLKGSEYWYGPAVNPWLNPYYHHGHGLLSFFYPPDPRGPADAPTDAIIPSFRLTLIQRGIQDYALLDVAEKGIDDAGNAVAVDAVSLQRAKDSLQKLWTTNTVQWYVSYDSYHQFSDALIHSFK